MIAPRNMKMVDAYVAAAGILLLRLNQGADDRYGVVICPGSVGGPQRLEIATRALRDGTSIIDLEFDPDFVRRGPASVTTCLLQQGRASLWPGCALWTSESHVTFVVHDELPFRFAVDRGALVILEGSPAPAELETGKTRAKRLLRRLTRTIERDRRAAFRAPR